MDLNTARNAARLTSFTLCTLVIGINSSGAVGVVGTDGIFSPAVGVVAPMAVPLRSWCCRD